MRLYKVVHIDVHGVKHVVYCGTQAEANNIKKMHNGAIAQTEVPTAKAELIKFLNTRED